MKHIAYSRRLPDKSDWIALVARVETIQDIIAAIKVSPCCEDDDILYHLNRVMEDLHCMIEAYQIANGIWEQDD